MGLLDRLGNVRYNRVVEGFQRIGSKVGLNSGRAGAAGVSGVAARAAERANREDTQARGQPPASGGVLATLASGVQAAINLEMALTAPLGKIPFPHLPALRVWDMDVGLPHAHNHPPNITPPNPVPIPLPSMGPILPIPILSGATKTLINGTAAARCGDMGAAIWCGGYFPMFEVFLGSAHVWIENARAGRLGIDITKHCTFSSPKPSDPPLGPMVGTTVASGSGNVQIGGCPLPSLFSLALAQAFKALFKGLGAVFRKLSAARYVRRLMRSGHIQITPHPTNPNYVNDVIKDLNKIAGTRSGRGVLDSIRRSGRNVTIEAYTGAGHNGGATAKSWDAFMDIPTGFRMPGADSTVNHTPGIWANHAAPGSAHPYPGSSSDAVLFHELNHCNNNALGQNRRFGTSSTGKWDQRWKNFEEYSTTHADNGYRAETGLPQRTNYGHVP